MLTSKESLLITSSLSCVAEEGDEEAGSRGGDWAEEMEAEVLKALPAEAQEQRLTNLLQSLLVAACLGTLLFPSSTICNCCMQDMG